jgi:hypothetical protein
VANHGTLSRRLPLVNEVFPEGRQPVVLHVLSRDSRTRPCNLESAGDHFASDHQILVEAPCAFKLMNAFIMMKHACFVAVNGINELLRADVKAGRNDVLVDGGASGKEYGGSDAWAKEDLGCVMLAISSRSR